jgi:hypothetical protein
MLRAEAPAETEDPAAFVGEIASDELPNDIRPSDDLAKPDCCDE